MSEHLIKYRNIYMTVIGKFYKGFSGDYEQPPEPHEFSIDKVMIGDADIYQLVDDQLEEIEKIVLEKYYENI